MAKKTTKKAAPKGRRKASKAPPKEHPTTAARRRAAQQQASEAYRKKEPVVVDTLRGPGDHSYSVENIIPDPQVPEWLAGRFNDPSKVVIFQSLNPGLILSLKKPRVFWDANMTKQEEGGFIAKFGKKGNQAGFFATDDAEIITLIKASPRYGAEFWDVQDAKKAAQDQNFSAFVADINESPELLERLVRDNPEKIRTMFKRLGVADGAEFAEDVPGLEGGDTDDDLGPGPDGPYVDDGDDFE